MCGACEACGGLLEIVVGDTVLCFELLQVLLLLLGIELLGHLVLLVVQHNDVAVSDIETRKMLTRVLGIKDVFVHHVCGSLGIGSISTAPPSYPIHAVST
jgi:hypothetical protein